MQKTLNPNPVPNIVLITLDAFNYNIALQNLNKLSTFKRLRQEGVSFENAFSVGPNTFFAFPGIIGSIYPYYFGVGIPKEIDTIASLLKQKGYNTALINESNALLTPYYGYHKGIDYQEHFLGLSHDKTDRELKEIFLGMNKKRKEQINKKRRIIPIINTLKFKVQNNKILQKPLRILYSPYKFINLKMFDTTECYKERRTLHDEFRSKIEWFISTKFREPQFLWIHTIVNHLPYLPPDTERFSENEIDYLNYIGLSKFMVRQNIQKLKELYIESLKTTDNLLKFIIDKLDENNVLENTLVIITADHGEEFMENSEYYEHNPESSSDDLLHVPLIFYNLSNFLEIDNIEFKTPVSSIDVPPTIVDLVGIPQEKKNKMRGQSLVPEITHTKDERQKPRALYSEAWQLNGLLDRNPGYLHDRAIFTVRYKKYKLKVILERKKGYYVEKHVSLYDWLANKELNINDHYEKYITLYSLLITHLHGEYTFAKKVKHEYETQKLKRHLTKIKLL